MLYTEENFKNAKRDDVFEFICPNCGKVFTRSKRYINKNRGIIPKYCCHKCSSDAKNQGNKTVICKECGKEYSIPMHEYNRKIEEGSNFFCSRSCAAKFNNKAFPKRQKNAKEEAKKKEKKQPCRDFELGRYVGYEEKEKYVTTKCSQIRKDARRFMDIESKQEKVCYYCKNHEFDNILEVHHKIGILEFDRHTKISEINSDSNLVWLCPNHHKMVERGLIKLE